MSLLESGEMYLETIYVLMKKKDKVRSIDVSEEIGFTKPSVSRAMSNLKQGEYITIDKDGYISFTTKGMEIAMKIYERHEVLTSALMKLGVSEEIAMKDACKIEHDISNETFEAIKKLIN